ncbi:hypothetical protein [Marinobacter lipolyticus]|uniref:hypothetical protein n=1 Tax=Marinobacter lipolyticus TaxID=209639 RepID=UPI003A930D26
MQPNFERLIDEALSKVDGIDIYTFALYHDHESGFFSICIDTKENSDIQVAESNKYAMKHFRGMISESDIEGAMLWQANVGRNLSLGDFHAVNIAEIELTSLEVDDSFYLAAINALQNKAELILQRSSHGQSLLFCCSTANDEVGLTWVQENA